MNTTFKIHRPSSTGQADFSTSAPSELNNTTRGETATFTLEIDSAENYTIASGETLTVAQGEAEYYGTLTVDGTLNVDGEVYAEVLDDNGGTVNISATGEVTLLDTVSDSGELLAVDEYAGKHSVEESFRGTQYFKEFTPDNVSLIIGIEPNQDLQAKNIPGVWGLVSNVVDERTTTLNTNRLTLEVTVLATFAEYSSAAAVSDALETQ